MIGRVGLLFLAVGLAAAAPAELTGFARVVDGDTFSLGAERVRLWGVDAPEGRQVCQDGQGRGYACGDVARDQLVGLIGGRSVRCEVRDRDPYGRAVRDAFELAGENSPGPAGAGWAAFVGVRDQGEYQRQGPAHFHVPGQEDYAATRVDAARGERWFWSAAEAIAAGCTAVAR